MPDAVARWEKSLDAKLQARLQTPLPEDEARALGLRNAEVYAAQIRDCARPCAILTARLPDTARRVPVGGRTGRRPSFWRQTQSRKRRKSFGAISAASVSRAPTLRTSTCRSSIRTSWPRPLRRYAGAKFGSGRRGGRADPGWHARRCAECGQAEMYNAYVRDSARPTALHSDASLLVSAPGAPDVRSLLGPPPPAPYAGPRGGDDGGPLPPPVRRPYGPPPGGFSERRPFDRAPLPPPGDDLRLRGPPPLPAMSGPRYATCRVRTHWLAAVDRC